MKLKINTIVKNTHAKIVVQKQSFLSNPYQKSTENSKKEQTTKKQNFIQNPYQMVQERKMT